MAQTEHLPIYKAAYDLCLHLEQAGAGSAAPTDTGSARNSGRARGVCCGWSCARRGRFSRAVDWQSTPHTG